MSFGMALDFIHEHLSMKYPDKEKQNVRKATQSDFDNF